MLSSARLLLAATAGLLLFAAPGLAATPIGKVVAVVGSPTGSGRPLSAGSPVYENDRLQTGRGNIQIIFVDDTKLVVGPNSTLVIDRFLMRGGNRARKFSVDALRGTFRFISGNSAKNAYDIETANATIGIRGTAFDFSSGRTTLVAVVEGLVRLCASGRCESIPDNCGVGRAQSGDVDELGGRAKGRALRALPYIVNQGQLTRPFRLNTRSCRSSVDLYENFFGGGRNSNGRSGGSTRGSPGNGGGGGEGGGEGQGGGEGTP
ncbi:MAG: FecR domain-containing protein [Parvibaculaceae bacterium]